MEDKDQREEASDLNICNIMMEGYHAINVGDIALATENDVELNKIMKCIESDEWPTELRQSRKISICGTI